VLMFHGTLDQNVDIDQARLMRGARDRGRAQSRAGRIIPDSHTA